jgi:C1A family cysteine protease
LEFLEIKAGAPFCDLSRLFGYYNELDAEGSLPDDAGAQIRTGIKVTAKLGVCTENLWPYIVSQFAVRPADACYLAAGNHTIDQYHRLLNLNDMKACLAMGLPFVAGISVYKSMMSDGVAATGDVPMPSRWERITGPIGGHALCFVGYDDATRRLTFRNSWGVAWGDQGYGYLPYSYIQPYVSDAWVIQRDINPVFASLPPGAC